MKNEPDKHDIAREKDGKWKVGQSGNPDGRTKGISITELVKAELGKIPEGKETTNAAQIVQKILDKAIADGDNKMIEKIWAYIDGMPKQDVDLHVFDPDKAIRDLEKQFE